MVFLSVTFLSRAEDGGVVSGIGGGRRCFTSQPNASGISGTDLLRHVYVLPH